MRPTLLAAIVPATIVLATTALASTGRAQSTEVHVEVVVVDVEVTTAPPPPPAVVVEESAPRDPNAIVPIVRARGELLLMSGDYDFAAWGGSASVGARLGRGFSAGVVVGYLAEIGGDPSEVDLALELEKDFSPLEGLGFVLLARLGTAFMLDDGDPQHEGPRLVGALGVGTRVDVDPSVAVTLDLRGVLRYRPSDDPVGRTRDSVTGGAMITVGLRFLLE